MSSTKTNIIFNFAGRIVPTCLSIVVAPMYLDYLSVEYYGVIGFFAAVQAFLMLLDGGISPSLNREMARYSAFPEKSREIRNTARTLEILCWILAIGASGIALVVSPLVAEYWLKPENTAIETLKQALLLMSVNFAFQWVTNFYLGGLNGLQKQKAANTVNIGLAFPRSIGSILILAYVSPTITAILSWQLLISIINCILFIILFWRSLPENNEIPRFDSQIFKSIFNYAAGMFGTSIVVLILTQADKIILTKLLTLKQFGYYSLAQTLAGLGIGMIISSITATYFPQFSQLVAQESHHEIKKIYHRSCQVMSFFLLPIVCTMAFFSYQILVVWTRDVEVAENAYLLLSLIALGTGLNGLMTIPYYMQLAHGITKIGIWQNVIAIVILIPLMIYGTTHYGAIGGAAAWTVLNFGYLVFSIPIMHKMILKDEMKKWYLQDTLMPVLVSLILNFIAYFLFIEIPYFSTSNAQTVAFVAVATAITFVVLFFVVPTMREAGVRRFRA